MSVSPRAEARHLFTHRRARYKGAVKGYRKDVFLCIVLYRFTALLYKEALKSVK